MGDACQGREMLLDIFCGRKDYFLMKTHTKKDLQASLKVGKQMTCVYSIPAIAQGCRLSRGGGRGRGPEAAHRQGQFPLKLGQHLFLSHPLSLLAPLRWSKFLLWKTQPFP